jgi:hypothetical protein
MLVMVFKETLWQLYGSSVIVQKQFTDMAIQSKTFDSSRYFDFDLRSQASTLGGSLSKFGIRYIVGAVAMWWRPFV